MSRSIRCVIMRGGTSKAVFLKEADLPPDRDEQRHAILAIFGSPDSRQIDGLGGADPLTSKVAIIGPARAGHPRAAGTHLTYTFGQVGISAPEIDYLSLCGNISAAVGAFAVYEGLVEPTEPVTIVRAYNTNLDRVLTLEVPVKGNRPVERGDHAVAGVPGTGARIVVDLADTAGAATGALLPTGNLIDRLAVPDFGEIDASLVDIGNAHVFVRASDVGLNGTETAAEIDARTGLSGVLEGIRAAAALEMRMISDVRRSREESPATPLLGIVSPAGRLSQRHCPDHCPCRAQRSGLTTDVHAAGAQDLCGDEHGLHRRGESHSGHGGSRGHASRGGGPRSGSHRPSGRDHRNGSPRRARRRHLRGPASGAGPHRPSYHGGLRVRTGQIRSVEGCD